MIWVESDDCFRRSCRRSALALKCNLEVACYDTPERLDDDRGEERMVRKPATKFAKLRKKMDQRKARAMPVKKIKI